MTYNARNRLVQVKNSGSTLLETFSYDGLKRKITETPNGGTASELYYSASWQVVEERQSGVAKVPYVWSPVYVDAMIERDRDTNPGTGGFGGAAVRASGCELERDGHQQRRCRGAGVPGALAGIASAGYRF